MHTIWWWCTHPKPDEHTQSKSRNHSLENNPLEQVHTSTNTNRQKYQLDKPLTDWDDQWLRVQKQTLRKSIPYYTQNNVKTRVQTDSALTRIWTLNVNTYRSLALPPLDLISYTVAPHLSLSPANFKVRSEMTSSLHHQPRTWYHQHNKRRSKDTIPQNHNRQSTTTTI